VLSALVDCDAAEARLPAVRQSSSEDLGWQSVLARTYSENPHAEEFTTLPTPNLLVVAVTGGTYAIDSRRDGRWRSTVYRAGSAGMTAPGNTSTLRWQAIGRRPLTSLQVYLTPELFTGIRRESDEGALTSLPDALAVDDPVVSTITASLGWAVDTQASALYADSAAQFLAVHMVERHLRCRSAPNGRGLGTKVLEDVIGYMHDHLAHDISLEELAAAARLSKHHFLRSFKTATGTTPHSFLVEIRMQRASELLRARDSTVSWVAAQCGYRSPSHFAAAFHRHHGRSPTVFRAEPQRG
jgi:AraC family transcriptional regulator